jgi:hypothetical protein
MFVLSKSKCLAIGRKLVISLRLLSDGESMAKSGLWDLFFTCLGSVSVHEGFGPPALCAKSVRAFRGRFSVVSTQLLFSLCQTYLSHHIVHRYVCVYFAGDRTREFCSTENSPSIGRY